MSRYSLQIPPVYYEEGGYPSVYCDFDSCSWESLTWGRWASGGEYDARHLFVDDWRMEHLWRKQGEGMAKAILQGIVTGPDFTIDTHFPLPVVAFQVWRSRTLSALWQSAGVIVIPVLQWGSPCTFDICAHGISPHSVVAVRGPQKGSEVAWLAGMNFMLTKIQPSFILHFGRKISYPGNILFRPLRSERGRSLSAQ
jgi:hypothetical protein